jgi:site-specific recombinase XerD
MSYVQQACDSIAGFRQRYEKFSRELVVGQYAIGTVRNYTSKIASISLHYNRLPELLSRDEITIYLNELLLHVPLPCKSMFEHTVVGLRCYYKWMGYAEKQMELPALHKPKKLPVVLSESEVEKLLHRTCELREKSILSMLYSCGLRVSELCSLEIANIDSSRMMVLVGQSKGRKDRYIPLAHKVLPLLRKYLKSQAHLPLKYLFESNPGKPLEPRAVSDILKKNCLLIGLRKKITCHSLRHSYATHLLEMGESILRISELLGHSSLKSTLIYLHVARLDSTHGFSPLDRLFENRKG